MDNFISITLTALLTSNIVASLGFGAISLQSEKRNFFYMLTASMVTIVSTIIAGLLAYLVNTLVLVKLEVEFLNLFVIVLLSSLVAFFARLLVKAISKEMFYLYEKSYQFSTQTIISVAIIMIVSNTNFMNTMFELATYCLGFLVVQLIFYPLYARIDNTKVLKPARNIPLMLYILSMVSMIIYTIILFI